MFKEIYIIIIFVLLFLIVGSLFGIFWLNRVSSETELLKRKKLLCYRIFLVSAGLMILFDGINQVKSLWRAMDW